LPRSSCFVFYAVHTPREILKILFETVPRQHKRDSNFLIFSPRQETTQNSTNTRKTINQTIECITHPEQEIRTRSLRTSATTSESHSWLITRLSSSAAATVHPRGEAMLSRRALVKLFKTISHYSSVLPSLRTPSSSAVPLNCYETV